ncbi:MAG: hypothetical protein KUG77_25660 [Nannocystaceae bacterium]|nr:hypothetical protein [Nannocystaceae bacterium]
MYIHQTQDKPLLRLLALLVTGVALMGCDAEPIDAEEELAHELNPSEIAPGDELDIELVEPGPEDEYVPVSDRVTDSFAAEGNPVAFRFLSWHSEETPGSSQCADDEVVTGFNCSGSFCDNLQLECHDYGTNTAPSGTWSAWFEHNGKAAHVCPAGSKMTGIDCWGDYCDNVAIECTSAPNLDTARCHWSGWYSEENPSPFFADVGDAIQGIWCSGTHCANKSFLVCET